MGSLKEGYEPIRLSEREIATRLSKIGLHNAPEPDGLRGRELKAAVTKFYIMLSGLIFSHSWKKIYKSLISLEQHLLKLLDQLHSLHF